MSDNELLLAISEMMDSKIAPIRKELRDTKDELKTDNAVLRTEFKGDIANLRSELKTDIGNLRSELKTDIANLRSELKGDITAVRSELKGDIESLRSELGSVKLTLENDIRPRLQNIEDCYISTYKRYQSGINQLEAMQQDIDVIKKVVLEHSEKLNKIA